MASRFPRRASDWSVEARRRELSELTFWELCFCLALASFAFFPLLFFLISSRLSRRNVSRVFSFFVCYHFFSRTDCYLLVGGPVGLPQRIGYSGTSARRSRRRFRSSVETIWQGKRPFCDCDWNCLSIAECRSHQATGFGLAIMGTCWRRSFWAFFLGRERGILQSCLNTRPHRFIRMISWTAVKSLVIRVKRWRRTAARNSGSECRLLTTGPKTKTKITTTLLETKFNF
jgi:hypothetical protein